MKRFGFANMAAALVATVVAAPSVSGSATKMAQFDYVEYRPASMVPVLTGMYDNPILPGFHPDPTITSYKDEYLLVTSTFTWMPGFPVYRSKDLVNWKLASHAVTPQSGFKMDGLGVTRGMFAPAITAHKGKLYLVSTCVDCGGNFIVTADRPEGPWSKPVWLDFEGIDPSLYFDADGTAWIVNNGAPEGPAEYEGHRAIWIQQFDPAKMTMVGPRKMLIDKGVHPAEKPIWIEGPHIYRKDGFYYLLAAEGGTADQHSQTIFRARDITGPYKAGPTNPILTQRNLDRSRPDRVEATGHADFAQRPDGSWWAVFLATRPYRDQFTNMGRETFLLPVKWETNGWPIILPDGVPVPLQHASPGGALQKPVGGWRDEFDGKVLSPEWIWLKSDSPEKWHSIDDMRGTLTVDALGISAGDLRQPAFVGRRLQHHDARFETRVEFDPITDGQRAGLLALIDENHFLFAGIEQLEGVDQFVIRRRATSSDSAVGALIARFTLPKSASRRFEIALDFQGANLSVQWRPAGSKKWRLAASNMDGTFLASVNAGLFTGTVVGPHASSSLGN